ncbi:MAG: hypothetical protein R3D81_10950 [Thalassovita sp.]
MVRRLLLGIMVWLAWGPVGYADDVTGVARLMQLLRMDETVEVMRLEGLKFGLDLGRDMLPGGGGTVWATQVERLYDVDRMQRLVETTFAAALDGVDTAPLTMFFASDLGQRIIEGELSTRRLFLSPEEEQVAREAFSQLDPDTTPMIAAIAAYMRTNDLVDYNVVGVMNANYAFYRGLADGGMIQMSEDEILSEAWASEAETRTDTREWLFAYLLQSYSGLTPEDMTRYTELSATPEGQALNRALFAGFDQMYGELSFGLGLAISAQGQGEEL